MDAGKSDYVVPATEDKFLESLVGKWVCICYVSDPESHVKCRLLAVWRYTMLVMLDGHKRLLVYKHAIETIHES